MTIDKNYSFGHGQDVNEKADDFDPIPVGNYPLQAVDVSVVETKNGSGLAAECQFTVTDGPFENRRIFQMFLLEHQSEKAVNIGRAAIKNWMIGAGLDPNQPWTVALIEALEGSKFIAKVGIERDKTGQYADKNRIMRFVNAGAPVQAVPSPQPESTAPAPAQAAGGGRKPWE